MKISTLNTCIQKQMQDMMFTLKKLIQLINSIMMEEDYISGNQKYLISKEEKM